MKRKKLKILILWLLLICWTLSACASPAGQSAAESLRFDPTMQTDAEPPDAAGCAVRYLDYEELDGHACYRYSGREVLVTAQIENGAVAFEAGVCMAIDGIFTPCELSTDGEQFSETGIMHRVNVPANDAVKLWCRFTPVTGKAGQSLNLALGFAKSPSYQPNFEGQKRYFQSRASHTTMYISAPRLILDQDAPTQTKAIERAVEKLEIPASDWEQLVGTQEPSAQKDAWRETRLAALHASGDDWNLNTDVVTIPRTEHASVELDLGGMAANYRVSVFVNQELLELAPGCTYADMFVDTEHITRLHFDLPTAGLGESNSIYAVLFVQNTGDLYSEMDPEDTYTGLDETGMNFLVFDDNPNLNAVPDDPTEPSTEPTETVDMETGTALDFPANGWNWRRMDWTDDGKLLAIQNSEAGLTACVYDPESQQVTASFPISTNTQLSGTADGKLITVDNPGRDNAELNVYDYGQRKLIASYPLTGKRTMSSLERQQLVNLYSGYNFGLSSYAMMLNTDGSSLLLCDCSYHETTLTVEGVSLIDVTTGEERELPEKTRELLEKNVRGLMLFFGNRFLIQTYEQTKTNSFVYDLDGQELAHWDTPRGDTWLNAFSLAADTLVYREVPTKAGASLSGTIELLNLKDLSRRTVHLSTSNESMWARLSPDGSRLLTYDEHADVFRIYDAESTACLQTLRVDHAWETQHQEQFALYDAEGQTLYVQTTITGSGSDQNSVVAVKIEEGRP